MAKLGYVGFGILLVNTLLACWMTFRRYSVASHLDAKVTGTVLSVHQGQGRAPNDQIVATYVVDGKSYTVRGSSADDSDLNARKHPVSSSITVYYNAADPEHAALTPANGIVLWAGTAVLLLLASAYVGFLVFKR